MAKDSQRATVGELQKIEGHHTWQYVTFTVCPHHFQMGLASMVRCN